MKKISSIPSILIVLTIVTLGLTSCSKKYGCYYSQTTELKLKRVAEQTNDSCTTDVGSLNTYCTPGE